ncbi:hypothetical protein SAMN04488514_102171 [Kriegella aquimaris]|uniref:Uncharacterized protein n=2 Tax=Kriegella aquimaris TaxID=192904 RepID=A0A1G9LR77_9FLAO|nr:hypothetical protein SAMN04488514_102171 [Kriegella aquimaris]
MLALRANRYCQKTAKFVGFLIIELTVTMSFRSLFFPMIILCLYPNFSFGQEVKNVPEAFKALDTTPEVIVLKNTLDVPTANGHFQGVQVMVNNGVEKILISGSSQTTAYVLQADLATQKTDRLIPLMKEPFRHAGGIQVSEPYMVVGIEDNVIKTASKVCLYNYKTGNLYRARQNMIIKRQGEVELQTAGATGLLAMKNGYLMLVSNWDSRNWDFYRVNPKTGNQKILKSFAAPDDWAGYQSINLIKDDEAIYAIGTYEEDALSYADLILVSNRGTFEPIMKKVLSKAFYCKNGVDFGGAAGLQVDNQGALHLWGTQKSAVRQITINRFSQQ